MNTNPNYRGGTATQNQINCVKSIIIEKQLSKTEIPQSLRNGTMTKTEASEFISRYGSGFRANGNGNSGNPNSSIGNQEKLDSVKAAESFVNAIKSLPRQLLLTSVYVLGRDLDRNFDFRLYGKEYETKSFGNILLMKIIIGQLYHKIRFMQNKPAVKMDKFSLESLLQSIITEGNSPEMCNRLEESNSAQEPAQEPAEPTESSDDNDTGEEDKEDEHPEIMKLEELSRELFGSNCDDNSENGPQVDDDSDVDDDTDNDDDDYGTKMEKERKMLEQYEDFF